MKYLSIVLSLLLTPAAQACLGEAQIIAKVSQVHMVGPSCHVVIEAHQISHFSENMMCPLMVTDILNQGVFVTHCRLNAGDSISGVVAKEANGNLTLN